MFDVNRGVFNNHADFRKQKPARQAFYQVIQGYIQARSTPPLAAISYDRFKPNYTKGPVMIHYIADIELAVRHALGNNPALIRQFAQIVAGENVPDEDYIAYRCGRVFQMRRLIPRQYFKFEKKGRTDRRPSGDTAPQKV